METVTPWLTAIGIFIMFTVFCGLFHWLFLKFIHFISTHLPINADVDLATAFNKPARIAIIVLGITAALKASPISEIADNYWFIHLVHSIMIICGYWIAYNLCTSTNLFFSVLIHKYEWNIDSTLAASISTALHALILCFGIATLFSAWGFDISGFIAGLSIGGLAFSLAAKDSLSNIFAGLVILIDRPFNVGDWIVCNNIEGTVEIISFRSTCVRTFPQGLVYIPNSLISGAPIINYSKRGKQRLALTLGVTYSTTKEQLETLVTKIRDFLQKAPEVRPEDVVVTFDNMNSSSLDIRIVCYCQLSDYTDFLHFKEKVNFALMGMLEEVGASAAFPSTSVYIEKTPEEKKL